MKTESINSPSLSPACTYRERSYDSSNCIVERPYVNWKILVLSFIEKFRKLSEDPLERLTEMGVKEGMIFLDVRCALGFYSFPAASIVGEKGLVYALDINADFTKYVSEKAKKKGIKNTKAITAKAENTGLSSQSVDIVFLHLVLHDIEDKQRAVKEFNRILKARGKLIIDEENVIPLNFIRRLAEETGFRLSKILRKTIQIFERDR